MIASAPATLRMVRRRGTLHILHGMKERPWISLILNVQKGEIIFQNMTDIIFWMVVGWSLIENILLKIFKRVHVIV